MIRKAFMMSVNRGAEAEYERRHNPIWPELEAILRRHGAHNYSIFLEPAKNGLACRLFAYVEVESEECWRAIAETEECRRWWAYMSEIMPVNADKSPVSVELKPVFHLP